MLIFSFIFSVICLWRAGDTKELDPRPVILGGERISIEEAPFTAIYRNSLSTCGASIISERFVLSAAHCYGPGTGYVIVGTSNQLNSGKLFEIETYFIHPKFRHIVEVLVDYDILLLKLKGKLTFSEKIQPIKLADADFEIQGGEYLETFGFGVTSEFGKIGSQYLLKVTLPYIEPSECEKTFLFITDRMICAGETGRIPCKGDSGGPLVYNNFLVGVTSFGVKNCTHGPSVFAKISTLRDFIDNTITQNS